MKKYLKVGFLACICIGFCAVTGMIALSLSYKVMVDTSTPEFCASCHEIESAVSTWRTSTHVNNQSGVVADCMDCHLPETHKPFTFFYKKTMHGLKDFYAHYFGDAYDRKKARGHFYDVLDNDRCLKCHKNILYLPGKRGAMLAHRSVLYPREGYEKKCSDCHKNLVHNKSEVYRFKQFQPPYKARTVDTE